MPPEAYPTQRLYRIKYQGPEGKASFKLALYLESAESYRMQASDALGRKLWSLDLDPTGRATWLDHRGESFCKTSGGRLDFLPLARMPLASLPKLLLGRLPTPPFGDVQRSTAGHLTYLDQSGQRWNGSSFGQGLEWWSLEEAGDVVAWWRREEEGGSFVHRGTDQQVRWQEVVREVLQEGLTPVAVPRDYAERECGLIGSAVPG